MATSTLAIAQDDTQRLRPWASLPADGQLPPEWRAGLNETTADNNVLPPRQSRRDERR